MMTYPLIALTYVDTVIKWQQIIINSIFEQTDD